MTTPQETIEETFDTPTSPAKTKQSIRSSWRDLFGTYDHTDSSQAYPNVAQSAQHKSRKLHMGLTIAVGTPVIMAAFAVKNRIAAGWGAIHQAAPTTGELKHSDTWVTMGKKGFSIAYDGGSYVLGGAWHLVTSIPQLAHGDTWSYMASQALHGLGHLVPNASSLNAGETITALLASATTAVLGRAVASDANLNRYLARRAGVTEGQEIVGDAKARNFILSHFFDKALITPAIGLARLGVNNAPLRKGIRQFSPKAADWMHNTKVRAGRLNRPLRPVPAQKAKAVAKLEGGG